MRVAWQAAVWARTSKLPALAEVLAPYAEDYEPPTEDDRIRRANENGAAWVRALKAWNAAQAGG